MSINAKNADSVGLFGGIAGAKHSHVIIENLKLQNLNVRGNQYVGGVAGEAEYTDFINIEILDNCHISGASVVGGLIGSASGVSLIGINFQDKTSTHVEATEFKGLFCGAIRNSLVQDIHDFCSDDQSSLNCTGYDFEVTWEYR